MATVSGAGSPATPPPMRGARLQGWALASVLIALMLTLLLGALDQTIVGTALPTIARDLKGYTLLPWVGTAYLLSSATLTPIFGKLSDMFGRKWLLIGGVSLFLVGSMLCGLSQSMQQLIGFRAVQGLGAASIFGLVFTLVGDIFTPAERARWQGVFGIVFAVASAIGPVTGGFLTENFTWRLVFYVNVPIGVLALLALVIWLPQSISLREGAFQGWASLRRIDFFGAGLAAAATVCLLIGLTWGSLGTANNGYDWNSPQVIGILIAAAALYVGFFFQENHAADPILPMALFRNTIFASAAIAALLLGMAFFSIVYYLPTFIQGVLGQAATNSGIVVTPLTITIVFGSVAGGNMIARTGHYQWLMIFGAVVLTIGDFLISRLTADTSLGEVTAFMLVVGLGIGCMQSTVTLIAQNVVRRNQLGVATAAISYLRSLGSTLGIAIMGTVISSSFASSLSANFPKTSLPAQALGPLTNQNLLESALTDPVAHSNFGAYVNPTTNQTLHDTLLHQAAASVPPGPAHDTIVAQISLSIAHDLNLILAHAREALGTAIVDGFRSIFVVCVLIVIATIFIRDVPLQSARAPRGAPSGDAEAAPPIAAMGE